MIYGYLRVSTDEQDVNSQRQGVDDFAAAKGWKIDRYITDEGVSGGKDPAKRNLGPLLNLMQKDDILICSEISRLGRDLFMIMEILHKAMNVGCKIFTVKDRYELADDVQSKVLAFAFGLAAEIERQMIRQRTREGLRLRVKAGVLLGRPPESTTLPSCSDEIKEAILTQLKWGVPQRRLAQNFNIDRATLTRWLHKWGVLKSDFVEREARKREIARLQRYKDEEYKIVNFSDEQRATLISLIKANLTLPIISQHFDFSYEEIYDTVLCDKELHNLYRQHGHKAAVAARKAMKKQ